MRRFAVAAALLLTFTSQSASAAPAPHACGPRNTAEINRLRDYVRSFEESGFFSGVVLVEQGGKPVLFTARGLADRSFGVPVSRNTKFHIASLSKAITAAAVGRLIDQGKLSFDTPVGKILAGIPNGDRITIEQLLTHFSGLGNPDQAPEATKWLVLPHTTEQLVDHLRASKPIAEPGEKYSYSNANYWVLADVIEHISGVSYGEFIKREILDPLGMKDTAHRGDILTLVPELAEGYQVDGLNRYKLGDLVDWTTKTGNGSIYSTAPDLAKFYTALVGKKLLSPQTTDRVFGLGKPIGMGWFHRSPDVLGRQSVWYNGRSPGFGAYTEVFLDDGSFFVILSNLYTYAPTAMAEGIARILSGKPYQPMQPLKVYHATRKSLQPFVGRYRFGPEFHLPSSEEWIENGGDHLKMHWSAGGRVTTLIPIGPNRFFDPAFWATLDIVEENGSKVIKYRSLGFDKIYEAKRVG